MSHGAHVRLNGDCQSCHGDMRRHTDPARRAGLPAEASCIECHDGATAPQTCETCHPTGADGQLLHLAAHAGGPGGPLLPAGSHGWGMAHDLAFIDAHGTAAAANSSQCELCHDEVFCQDCHAGAIRPLRLHPPDYVRAHAIDARTMSSDCTSCHRLQSDCLACHERLGVGARDGAFGPPTSGSFHPPNWAGAPGQPQGHATQARANLRACVSCHSEDTCLGCHATTEASAPGLGANPHGMGYAGSARCEQLAALNRRVCLRCHAPGAAVLNCSPAR